MQGPGEEARPRGGHESGTASLLAGLLIRLLIFNAALFASAAAVEFHLFATGAKASYDPVPQYVELAVWANVAFVLYLVLSIVLKAAMPVLPVDAVAHRPESEEDRRLALQEEFEGRLQLRPSERTALDRLSVLSELDRTIRSLTHRAGALSLAMAVSAAVAAIVIVFAGSLTSFDASFAARGAPTSAWVSTVGTAVVRVGVPLLIIGWVVVLVALHRHASTLLLHYKSRRDLFTMWDGGKGSLAPLEPLLTAAKPDPEKIEKKAPRKEPLESDN